jgi:hypothetical protein
MTKRQIYIAALAIILFPFFRAVPAWAHGDKIIPHVVNGVMGTGQDAQRLRTKFDITNLGIDDEVPITQVTVLFRKLDGTAWTIATDQGEVSQITLNLGYSQTIRITTLGNGDYQHGYAIIRNLESTTVYAEDYEVSVSVFYEVLNASGGTIETTSVPIGQPTVTWTFPIEIDTSKNLGTGFAVVDLSGASNAIWLQLLPATTPSSGNTSVTASVESYALNANEKKAKMLTESGLFPTVSNFRGVLFGQSTGPVAILGLLVTPSSTGFQYATMAPTYLDSLRRNSIVYLPQDYALDADLNIVDYFHYYEEGSSDALLEVPWDVLLQTTNSAGTNRSLVAKQGAAFSIIGSGYEGSDFDGISQEDLRSLTYTTDDINMSDNSSNLAIGFTFAVKTGLGRYAKVRVRDYVGYPSSSYIDLILEIFVYK